MEDRLTAPWKSPRSILSSMLRASSEWPTSSNASVASRPEDQNCPEAYLNAIRTGFSARKTPHEWA